MHQVGCLTLCSPCEDVPADAVNSSNAAEEDPCGDCPSLMSNDQSDIYRQDVLGQSNASDDGDDNCPSYMSDDDPRGIFCGGPIDPFLQRLRGLTGRSKSHAHPKL
jgi:hypothetical protein